LIIEGIYKISDFLFKDMFHLLAPIHTSLGLVVGLVGSLIGLVPGLV
jgi:divalent metal cation (Fe/Co/Zn/Cd) transporter